MLEFNITSKNRIKELVIINMYVCKAIIFKTGDPFIFNSLNNLKDNMELKYQSDLEKNAKHYTFKN